MEHMYLLQDILPQISGYYKVKKKYGLHVRCKTMDVSAKFNWAGTKVKYRHEHPTIYFENKTSTSTNFVKRLQFSSSKLIVHKL